MKHLSIYMHNTALHVFSPQADVQVQEFGTSDSEICSFALVFPGEQKQLYVAPDAASRWEWVNHLNNIVSRIRIGLQHATTSAWISREGRRRAIFGQLNNVDTSDHASSEDDAPPSPSTGQSKRRASRPSAITVATTACHKHTPQPQVSRV